MRWVRFLAALFLCSGLSSFSGSPLSPLFSSAAFADEWVVVVNGYSSGSLYRPELKKRGYKVFHVQDNRYVPPAVAGVYNPNDYDGHIIFDAAQPQVTLRKLKELGVKAIFTGSENGIEVGDLLAFELGLPGNHPATSLFRRDKVEMYRATGTSHAVVANFAQAIALLEEGLFKFPVITKPRRSAGSEYFRIAYTPRDLAKNFEEAIGKPNMFGEIIDKLVLQPKHVGQEYAVNGVVWNGQILFTDVWRYSKKDTGERARIYDFDDLLSLDAPELGVVLPFVEQKLAEVDHRFGTFHVEVMVSPEEVPVLIEVAARAMGSLQPLMVRHCTGYDQILANIDAALNPDAFSRRLGSAYPLHKQGRVVELISHRQGWIVGVPLMGLLNKSELPSYVGHRIGVKHGEWTDVTRDLLTTHPGTVYFAHSDREQIHVDTDRLRAREVRNGVRTVRSRAVACMLNLLNAATGRRERLSASLPN